MSDERIVNGKIKFRRDSTENWEVNESYIPESGEPCYDITLNKLKIGNGTDTYGELPYLSDAEFEEINSEIESIKELVGDESVSDQISSAINAINFDDICQINSISIGETLIDIVNKSVKIPIATNSILGVVCGSNEILIGADGKLNVDRINISKIVQDENQTIILDNGNSNGY